MLHWARVDLDSGGGQYSPPHLGWAWHGPPTVDMLTGPPGHGDAVGHMLTGPPGYGDAVASVAGGECTSTVASVAGGHLYVSMCMNGILLTSPT